jgi:hypothetical protein
MPQKPNCRFGAHTLVYPRRQKTRLLTLASSVALGKGRIVADAASFYDLLILVRRIDRLSEPSRFAATRCPRARSRNA